MTRLQVMLAELLVLTVIDPQQLPYYRSCLPVLVAATINAGCLPQIQVSFPILLVHALFETRFCHPVKN